MLCNQMYFIPSLFLFCFFTPFPTYFQLLQSICSPAVFLKRTRHRVHGSNLMDFHYVPSHSALFLAEALEGPPLGVYRLRLQKDGGHPAKSQVCGALQSQKAAAECGTNEGADFSAPHLHNGPPPLSYYYSPFTLSHSPERWRGVGGWVSAGGWQGGWQKVMPGCQVSLKETRSVCVLKTAPPAG